MKKIGLLDYGAGNLGSVSSALARIGAESQIVKSSAGLRECDALVIPGVGSFAAAMKKLAPFRQAVREFAASGKPVLGICLGMQVLFDRGEEGGECEGLVLVRGKVEKMFFAKKLPHVGWNEVEPVKKSRLLEGVPRGSCFYFVHSYCCRPASKLDLLAFTDYGEKFVSAVERGNVFGVQFHPEKSGATGERLLENFWRMV